MVMVPASVPARVARLVTVVVVNGLRARFA
jgi:hypothetical protein